MNRRPSGDPAEPADATADFDRFAAAVRETFGTDAEHRLTEFAAFVRRRLEGDYSCDEFGFDADVAARMRDLVAPVAHHWFRVEVTGAEHLPADGGALIVSNHSGTLPWDALVSQVVVSEQTDRELRILAADLVFATPFWADLARKCGATLACAEDAERLLAAGHLVGVWPEGFKGIGKPFSERYKLQRFGRGGFVSTALRAGVPIVPCSVVGAEEIYPLIGNLTPLARLLGVPYVPVTPTFPWLGPLGLVPLPSKWLIEFGEPIRPETALGDDAAAGADDAMTVFATTDRVRETIQQTLYRLLLKRRNAFF